MRFRGLVGHRVTLPEVAKLWGVGNTAVSKWRRGEGMPDANRLAQMAEKMDVSVNWLWTGQGEMLLKTKEDQEFRQLLAAWLKLTPEQRRQLQLNVEVMLELARRNPPPAKNENSS